MVGDRSTSPGNVHSVMSAWQDTRDTHCRYRDAGQPPEGYKHGDFLAKMIYRLCTGRSIGLQLRNWLKCVTSLVVLDRHSCSLERSICLGKHLALQCVA